MTSVASRAAQATTHGRVPRRGATSAADDFAGIRRFHDPRVGGMTAKILPGEFCVTTADEHITTLLGSCVAACIWDPEAGVGGMNHFMVPGTSAHNTTNSARYGLFAMEFLINAILTRGAQRPRLVAKLAGGGNITRTNHSIGTKNVAFARDYLAAEGIDVLSEHVLGDHPRRVAFYPRTGACRVMELPVQTAAVEASELQYASDLTATDTPGDIELF